MQLHSKCNAIATRLKVTIVTTIKKGLPGNPHIAHYKKRSRERHETKNKRLANFLAKQMKNTQTSHDIKKGKYAPKAGFVLLFALNLLGNKIKTAENQTINSRL